MSTLEVSNLNDGTTTVATTYVTNGSAKAWIYGSTGAAALGSFNFSSGVDNGTGDYTYNVTNGFNSTNNFVVTMNARTSGDSVGPASSSGASGVVVHVYDISSNALIDRNQNIIIAGDLA